jgi:hypothetical protein
VPNRIVVVTLPQFIESSNPNAPTIRAMLDDAAGNFAPAPGEAPAGPGAHAARTSTPDAHGSSSQGQQGHAQQVTSLLPNATVQQSLLRQHLLPVGCTWGCLSMIRLSDHARVRFAWLSTSFL